MMQELTEGTVLVRGVATADVPPDYATIRIHVRERARTREKALDRVAERASGVDRVLDELGEVVSNRVTARARTTALRGAGLGDKGFEASRSLVCEIRDASELGALFERLVENESDFEGPWWQLDDTNPVFDDVRARAATDARTRASAYARGAGQDVGGLRWLAEPGLRIGGNRGDPSLSAPAVPVASAPAPGASRLRRGADEQDEPLLDVVVENLTVNAAVEAAFDLLDP